MDGYEQCPVIEKFCTLVKCYNYSVDFNFENNEVKKIFQGFRPPLTCQDKDSLIQACQQCKYHGRAR